MKLWLAAVFMSVVLLLAGPAAKSLPLDNAQALPDAPVAVAAQSTSQNPPAAPAGPSGTQTEPAANPQAPMTPEEQRKLGQEQLKQEERQRVWAVVATFNTTANRNAVPLTVGQKFQLF